MGAPMSAATIKGCLSGVPLFSGLTDRELDTLAAASRSVTFRKGARIFEEGGPAACCLLLTAGRAQVVLSGDGGPEILLGFIVPGSMVGEVALLDRSTRSAALVAMDDCHFIRISAAAFDELRRNPVFESQLVARVVSTLRDATDHVRGISAYSAIARVAWCLGRIARQEGTPDGRAVVIPKKPHHELAEMTGCTRETVSRALSTLRRKRCISWDGQAMRLEMEALQRYVAAGLEGAGHGV